MTRHEMNHRRLMLRGFTLVELMIAILVLIVVIVATSRIFGTASQIAGVGQASASIMQEAAALERRMRDDIAKLTTEGYFAIRQVAVRNDINLGVTGALLNPNLADDAYVRADQLVFFRSGVETPQTADFSGAFNVFGQGIISRMYYGHAVQIPSGQRGILQGSNITQGHDPGVVGAYPQLTSNFRYLMDYPHGLMPWRADNGPALNMVRTRYAPGGAGGVVYSRAGAAPYATVNGTQPDATRWLMSRQSVTLMDDDRDAPDSNSKTVYLGSATGGAGGVRTARSIFIDHPFHGFTREIRNGRLDAAATRADDIREYVERVAASGNLRPWNNPTFGGGVNADQRSIIASSIFYPRGERRAPSALRVDQALTNHVIGSAVSSIIIEWTWEQGVGEQRDGDGNLLETPSGLSQPGINDFFYGFRPNCWNDETDNWCTTGGNQPEQPWFGLNYPDRGVGFMGFEDAAINDPTGNGLHYYQRANFQPPIAVAIASGMNNAQNNIERYFGPGQGGVAFNPYVSTNDIRIYEAIFGYNRDSAFDEDGEAVLEVGYTPWPSAIRVTVVMHDPSGRIEAGREYQFIIDLPQRVR
jgi:type II secretory pathway pseudopilin PulG